MRSGVEKVHYIVHGFEKEEGFGEWLKKENEGFGGRLGVRG